METDLPETWMEDLTGWLGIILIDEGIPKAKRDSIMGSFQDLLVNRYGDD